MPIVDTLYRLIYKSLELEPVEHGEGHPCGCGGPGEGSVRAERCTLSIGRMFWGAIFLSLIALCFIEPDH